MAKLIKPRVKVPNSVSAGEVFTIKTLINHRMESGLRKDKQGALIPRMIIHHFITEFEGETVFEADIAPGVSASPYFSFSAKVDKSGTFTFTWTDDEGSVYQAEQSITVD